MTLIAALLIAHSCGTPTSWAERVDPDGTLWVPVCGDANGAERSSCAARAALRYALASYSSGAVHPDAAWEDEYASCGTDGE